MNNEKKYYIVTSKTFAITIHYMTGLQYFAFEDKKNPTKQVYSFEDNSEFRQALTSITSLRNSLRK